MSSLVTEVLSSAGKLEKEDLCGRITKLKRRIDEIKIDVQETLDMYWIEFSPCFATATDLTNKLSTAQSEIESLVQKMENEIKPQIQVAVSDFQELSNQLKDARIVADMVENLMKIHECMEACDEAQEEKNFLLAAQSLQQANMYNRTDICGRDVKIFQTLKTELIVKKEKLAFDLKEVWNQLIAWTFDGNTTTLALLIESSYEMEKVISLVRALHLMNNLGRFIEEFGKKLLLHILKPVITYVVQINTSNETTITLTIEEKNRAPPSDVFLNLRAVFSFLCNTFLNTTLVEDVNATTSNETAMNILGKMIGHEFCKCLVEDCLDAALPSHTKDLEEYSKVIKLTTDLQQSLVHIGFLQKDLSTTLEYVQNVDILFANKMCQQFLIRARNTLKKELHNTIVVCPETSSFELFEDFDNITLEQTEEKLLPQKGFSSSLFKFPKCHISIFTKEILELVHEVMQEATKSNSTCAAKLFYTARNICELYCDVVPIYHQDTITLIPQQTAIYHNNCMYLAHNLLTLGHQYQNRLPAPLVTCPVTFIDLVSQLRNSGKDLFLSQMRQQKQQLLQFLQDNAVFQNLSTDERMLPKAEQAVKQCLCQLQFLSRAWSETLPSDVYCRAIGTLLNTCLEEIMLRIVCMEDITVPCAARLISIFSLITSQVPDLFKSTEKEETTAGIVNFYVRKWNKFQRLQWILGASMREIVDLWSSGKGVLAVEFAADEIKQLIRALFQNTDRRAAALAKIR